MMYRQYQGVLIRGVLIRGVLITGVLIRSVLIRGVLISICPDLTPKVNSRQCLRPCLMAVSVAPSSVM